MCICHEMPNFLTHRVKIVEEREAAAVNTKCIVCFTNTFDAAVDECGHMFCRECLDQLTASDPEEPRSVLYLCT
jgi:hypothetical protein